MEKVRHRDTDLETDLRRELFRRGLRYRLNFVALLGSRRTVDIAFPGPKLAVFLDGCFWHGCPSHRTYPKANADWWFAKIEANIARDLDTNARLEALGWTVIRVWGHEPPAKAADEIERVLQSFKRRG